MREIRLVSLLGRPTDSISEMCKIIHTINHCSLNKNKMKVVSFGRNIDHNYPYYRPINTVQLKKLHPIKNLGVTYDSQLIFRNILMTTLARPIPSYRNN